MEVLYEMCSQLVVYERLLLGSQGILLYVDEMGSKCTSMNDICS